MLTVRYTLPVLLLCSSLLFTGCLPDVQKKAEIYEAPYYLQHANLTIGILPSVGGLVVYLADESRSNILLSDSLLWFETENQLPKMGTQYQPKPYYGHTVWVGPQSSWWSKQCIDPSLSESGALWPPDPYLAFGRYTIISSSDSSITLQSPASPVSGVQMIKKITIRGKNKIHFEATITNIRKTPVAWDIWMNTRIDGNAHVYVPVHGIENIKKAISAQGLKNQAIHYTINEGYITFVPQLPGREKTKRSTKLFLQPDSPWIAAFAKKHLFVKHFQSYPENLIHPEQALVEIYNCISVNPVENVLELEHHGPFTTIQPGENITETEEWELFPYEGINELKEEIAFLKQSGF